MAFVSDYLLILNVYGVYGRLEPFVVPGSLLLSDCPRDGCGFNSQVVPVSWAVGGDSTVREAWNYVGNCAFPLAAVVGELGVHPEIIRSTTSTSLLPALLPLDIAFDRNR